MFTELLSEEGLVMMLVPYDKMIYFYAIEIGLVVRCQAVNF